MERNQYLTFVITFEELIQSYKIKEKKFNLKDSKYICFKYIENGLEKINNYNHELNFSFDFSSFDSEFIKNILMNKTNILISSLFDIEGELFLVGREYEKINSLMCLKEKIKNKVYDLNQEDLNLLETLRIEFKQYKYDSKQHLITSLNLKKEKIFELYKNHFLKEFILYLSNHLKIGKKNLIIKSKTQKEILNEVILNFCEIEKIDLFYLLDNLFLFENALYILIEKLNNLFEKIEGDVKSKNKGNQKLFKKQIKRANITDLFKKYKIS